jgi:hypothetical protein
MPYSPPRGKIISVRLIPLKDEIDELINYLREHNGCHGRDLPPHLQDANLLQYCQREGLISSTPRKRS